MSIITSASGSSCWRGLEYYKSKKVNNIQKINDSEYTSKVEGTKKYDVYLNLEHPRNQHVIVRKPLAKELFAST